MKKIKLGLVAIIMLIISSCTNPMDKPLNSEDFEEVKKEIFANKNYSQMKKNYIVDNLSEQLGFLEIGKAIGKTMGKDVDELKIPIFKEKIAELEVAFDSIRTKKIEIINNNKKLEKLAKLIDVDAVGLSKYKGYLSMELKFDNQFEKEILYVILNYKYVNKYDSEFFNKKVKLTDEIANNFKDKAEILTIEKYNDVAEFIYTKVPVQAKKTLRDKLGKEKADEKVKRSFLMEGLKIEVLRVVFKDKSELTKQNVQWKYLEE